MIEVALSRETSQRMLSAPNCVSTSSRRHFATLGSSARMTLRTLLLLGLPAITSAFVPRHSFPRSTSTFDPAHSCQTSAVVCRYKLPIMPARGARMCSTDDAVDQSRELSDTAPESTSVEEMTALDNLVFVGYIAGFVGFFYLVAFILQPLAEKG
eukprot:7390988-Prymnesium_polylepis.2